MDPTVSLKRHLIEQYRKMISDRYDYDTLQQHFSIPTELTRENIDALRNYFLEDIYPEAVQREQLDRAFSHMDTYLQQPLKLLRVLGNITWVTLKFGVQLPQAIKAGFTTLESYRAASYFEKKLLESAVHLELSAPMQQADFERCIAHLHRKDVEKFVAEIDQLIRSLTHVKLLEKTIEILHDLVKNMKKHDQVYTNDEILGLETGIQILKHGYELFKDLSQEQKEGITELIQKVERYHLHRIFDTYTTQKE